MLGAPPSAQNSIFLEVKVGGKGLFSFVCCFLVRADFILLCLFSLASPP